MTWKFWLLTVFLIVGCGILFFVMTRLGERLVMRQLIKEGQREKRCLEQFSRENIQNQSGILAVHAPKSCFHPTPTPRTPTTASRTPTPSTIIFNGLAHPAKF